MTTCGTLKIYKMQCTPNLGANDSGALLRDTHVLPFVA